MTSIELAELRPEKADALRAISHYRRYQKSEAVFHQGDNYKGPYMVAEGQFKIYQTGNDGKETIFNIFRAGEWLAPGPLFLGGGYPASCSAINDGCLVLLEYDRLKQLIAQEGEINDYFLEKSVLLIPRLKEKIENLSMRNAEQRIIAYLKSIGAEEAAVPLQIPKNQLAALLDLTPESVSRVLTNLTDKGAVIVDGKNYRLASRA